MPIYRLFFQTLAIYMDYWNSFTDCLYHRLHYFVHTSQSYLLITYVIDEGVLFALSEYTVYFSQFAHTFYTHIDTRPFFKHDTYTLIQPDYSHEYPTRIPNH